MPIKPENKLRYPKDWKQITERIKARAGNKCEGSPEYPNCRAENGKPHPVTGSKVVLTVAHLDHTPENIGDENLMAWCQRCHLNYDKHHHKASRLKSKNQPFTKEEKQINDLIVKAHNKFINLKDTHPLEKQEWVNSVHRLQDLLGARVLRRDYPDTFYSINGD